jgi:hypothetical protein
MDENICGLRIGSGKPKHAEKTRPQYNHLNDNATLPVVELNPGVCWDMARPL